MHIGTSGLLYVWDKGEQRGLVLWPFGSCTVCPGVPCCFEYSSLARCTLAQFPGEHSRPSTSLTAMWRVLRGAVWS